MTENMTCMTLYESGSMKQLTLTIYADRITLKMTGEPDACVWKRVNAECLEALMEWLDVFGNTFPNIMHVAGKIAAKL